MATGPTEAEMGVNLSEDYKMICAWLADLGFSGQLNFEINKDTICIMLAIMQKNIEMDRDRLLLVDNAERTSKEYDEEAKRLDEILKPLRATPDLLPEEAAKTSQSLVQIAIALGLDDVSETCYEMEMNNLAREVLDAKLDAKLLESSTRMWTRKNEELKKQIKGHETILDSLTKAISLDTMKNANNKEEMKFLSAKLTDYEERIDMYENASINHGMNSSLTHETLTKDFKYLDSLQKEAANMQAKLDGYKNLPPDISLANVTIAEAKINLQKLNEELDRRLNKLL